MSFVHKLYGNHVRCMQWLRKWVLPKMNWALPTSPAIFVSKILIINVVDVISKCRLRLCLESEYSLKIPNPPWKM